jgi:hypothetical protein
MSAPGFAWDRLYWKADGSVRLESLVEGMTGGRPGVDPAARSPPAMVKLFADWREGRVDMIADGGPDLGYATDILVPLGLARGDGLFDTSSDYLCGWDAGEIGPRFRQPRVLLRAEAVARPEPGGGRPGPPPYDDAALLDRVAHHYRTMTPKWSINGAVTLTIKELLRDGEIAPPIATSEAALRSRLRGKFKDQIIAGVVAVRTPANNGN